MNEEGGFRVAAKRHYDLGMSPQKAARVICDAHTAAGGRAYQDGANLYVDTYPA
jgi:hypothetical protein